MTIPLPILFVGDRRRDEFRDATEWLAERGAVLSPDVPAALAALRDDFAPAVIVVAQPWRGCFAARDIDRLRRAAPLARIVTLLDSWLEGETRSGKPWPAAQRMYWHQSLPRLSRQLERIAAGEPSALSLPITVANDERIGAQCHNEIAARIPDAPRPLVAVCARDRETADSLGDVLRQHGWRVIWLSDLRAPLPQKVDVILFDVAYTGPAAAQDILQFKQIAGVVPIVAIAGFPRSHDVRLLRAAGAAAVVSKPFFVDDLLWELEQLLVAAEAPAIS